MSSTITPIVGKGRGPTQHKASTSRKTNDIILNRFVIHSLQQFQVISDQTSIRATERNVVPIAMDRVVAMRGTLDYSDLGHLVGLKSSLSGKTVKNTKHLSMVRSCDKFEENMAGTFILHI